MSHLANSGRALSSRLKDEVEGAQRHDSSLRRWIFDIEYKLTIIRNPDFRITIYKMPFTIDYHVC